MGVGDIPMLCRTTDGNEQSTTHQDVALAPTLTAGLYVDTTRLRARHGWTCTGNKKRMPVAVRQRVHVQLVSSRRVRVPRRQTRCTNAPGPTACLRARRPCKQSIPGENVEDERQGVGGGRSPTNPSTGGKSTASQHEWRKRADCCLRVIGALSLSATTSWEDQDATGGPARLPHRQV